MREYKFDPSVPRRMYPSNVIPLRNRCPECGAKLEKEYHCYAVAAGGGAGEQLLLVGNDLGSFCPKCDVVVLDTEGFAGELSLGVSPEIRASKFVVLGIVDTDAVPEEKKDIPLGTDDNPVPLVKFTNLYRKEHLAQGT